MSTRFGPRPALVSAHVQSVVAGPAEHFEIAHVVDAVDESHRDSVAHVDVVARQLLTGLAQLSFTPLARSAVAVRIVGELPVAAVAWTYRRLVASLASAGVDVVGVVRLGTLDRAELLLGTTDAPRVAPATQLTVSPPRTLRAVENVDHQDTLRRMEDMLPL